MLVMVGTAVLLGMMAGKVDFAVQSTLFGVCVVASLTFLYLYFELFA